MTNLEHYFENLLYHGEDIKGEANKNALTEEQQKSVEQCAQYVIYSLFGTREHFDEWINREPASPWHRAEEPPKEYGNYLAVVNGEVMEVTYSDISMRDDWNWSTCDAEGFVWIRSESVTHWMPLPEPPKEDA